eukprot:TRINITY_DN11687_c0_g2_i7.p1 TRINITY_DN11687_c0_g2~~TRINITY_DN11687_c0_g2_i7.p1  ORF type:complete len:315 (+),score=71.94 TRINITY_DN11687_c0_g2_i7:169-1113(+)
MCIRDRYQRRVRGSKTRHDMSPLAETLTQTATMRKVPGNMSKPAATTKIETPVSPGGFDAVRPYLSLLRFSFHQNYLVVIIGMLLFPGPPAGGALAVAVEIVKLYFSFNVCLYGALYAINAVTDAHEDAVHPEKKHRPVASGVISKKQALTFVAGLMTTGFVTGYLFYGVEICLMYVLFVALNLGYSMGMRNMKFMRFWTAGLTSPARLHLGSMILGTTISTPCYFLAYFFMTALQSSKIRIENRKLKAEVNGFQPGVVEAVSFCGTALALYANYPNDPLVSAVCIFQNVLYIVLPNISGGAERVFRKIYTADC